jgi:hypothetical protein
LWFEFDNGADSVAIHIVGPTQEYQLEVRENYIPSRSRLFENEINVGWVKVLELTKSELVAIVSKTPVDNASRGFNCQVWVGDALKLLVEEGYIELEEYLSAVNGMIDATMEAKDEP